VSHVVFLGQAFINLYYGILSVIWHTSSQSLVGFIYVFNSPPLYFYSIYSKQIIHVKVYHIQEDKAMIDAVTGMRATLYISQWKTISWFLFPSPETELINLLQQ